MTKAIVVRGLIVGRCMSATNGITDHSLLNRDARQLWQPFILLFNLAFFKIIV
jgi:hypothetical protein